MLITDMINNRRVAGTYIKKAYYYLLLQYLNQDITINFLSGDHTDYIHDYTPTKFTYTNLSNVNEELQYYFSGLVE